MRGKYNNARSAKKHSLGGRRVEAKWIQSTPESKRPLLFSPRFLSPALQMGLFAPNATAITALSGLIHRDLHVLRGGLVRVPTPAKLCDPVVTSRHFGWLASSPLRKRVHAASGCVPAEDWLTRASNSARRCAALKFTAVTT